MVEHSDFSESGWTGPGMMEPLLPPTAPQPPAPMVPTPSPEVGGASKPKRAPARRRRVVKKPKAKKRATRKPRAKAKTRRAKAKRKSPRRRR